MTTVAQTFGYREGRLTEAHSSIALQCGVGIELELEGSDHIEADMWDCTEDGSLRNGCEMVCSRPYNGQELLDAINNLSEAVAESHAEGTWRCSTHVHMDMRDADSNILKKTILAWTFYEKMLFKCSGYHRYRSNFCPAFAVVQAQVMNASDAFNYDDEEFFNRLVRSWDKYTSLNLLPLAQYGSIEFRISEPKWKRGQLLNLVNRFLMLKKLALDNAEMSNDQFIEHLNTVRFAPMLPYLPLDYNLDESDLHSGYCMARDVLYCRSHEVEQSGRIRLRRTNSNGDVLVDLRYMSDFYGFLGYVRGNANNLYQEILVMLRTTDLSQVRHAPEQRIRAIFDLLRESGHSDNNITGYIPDHLENQLEQAL
ncbi:hypothetical protein [Escherichia phage vB-EcoP-XT32]|nr:hypothetical protein [Escherichia phage vB-EcoP-XT32]